MTTTRSATEIWLIGSSKSDLNISCLPTNGDVMRYFFHIFKNQNATTTDAVKRTIEAVTEIWLKSGIPMESSWLHSKQLLNVFESWKKFLKVRRAIKTPKEITENDFVKVWKHYLISLLKALTNKFLVVVKEPEKLKRKMWLF